MQPPSSDATWEELYDSGQLDHRLAKLNIKGTQQPSQRNPNGPPQGLIMRPLLPEQPQQQALVMPTTHHIVKAPGPHSMALFGNNPSSILPSNHVTVLNGAPSSHMMQPNGYSLNQNINTNPGVQNMRLNNGNGSNMKNPHEPIRPSMPMMTHPHNGFLPVTQGSINQTNIIGPNINRPQNGLPISKPIIQGPPPHIANNLLGVRPPFQSPPPMRMGPPEVPYQQMPFSAPPGSMVIPHMPLNPRPMGIPIDMSVPPPPLPTNGSCRVRAQANNFQNGIGPRPSGNKIHAQKQMKNKNSKNNSTSNLSNTQLKQKVSSLQPVFPESSSKFEPTDANASAIAYNSIEIESDHPRTQYRPPEPKVTILKRPVSTPNNLSLQASSSASGASDNSDECLNSSNNTGGINNIRTKSLKQREEEYAQARLRILGSSEPETSSAMNISLNDLPNTSTSQSTPDVMLAQKPMGKIKVQAAVSSITVSSPSLSNKQISSKNSNNTQSHVKEYNCPKEPNVGQGSDS